MSAVEFDEVAADTAKRIASAEFMDRVVAACRGSGNPAALAWLGDGLELEATTRVIDLGAGLGGPAAWMRRRYGCEVVGLEPAPGASSGCRELFDLPVVRGEASSVPFRCDAFDVALLLGVSSVVASPRLVFLEAHRIASRLGCLEYVSCSTTAVLAGGSRFPTRRAMRTALRDAGWHVLFNAPLRMSAPGPWSADTNAQPKHLPTDADESEAEVVAAIRSGAIEPHLYIGGRSSKNRRLEQTRR